MTNINWKYVSPLNQGKEVTYFNLEIKYHFELPTDLKDCIKVNNGGIPDKSKFKTVDNELVFGGLLSFNDGDTDSVYTYIHLFEVESNTVSMFPFGLDPFGNFFCIKDGKVVLFNHEEGTTMVLADDFTKFVSMLK